MWWYHDTMDQQALPEMGSAMAYCVPFAFCCSQCPLYFEIPFALCSSGSAIALHTKTLKIYDLDLRSPAVCMHICGCSSISASK